MRAITVFLILLVAARPAEADCKCEREAPCEAYWDADVVFVGTVTLVQKPKLRTTKRKGTRPPMIILDFRSTATLEVSETFRGTVDKTVTVETAKDCMGMSWRTGKRYIVYANRDGNRLVTGTCTRTNLLDKLEDDDDEQADEINMTVEQAAADLAYARSKPESAARGFVQGIVSREADNNRRGPRPPVAGAQVTVRGLPKAVTKTNARGAFKILLPPGDHQLDITAPGLRVNGQPPAFTIAARGACAIVEPTLIASGIARGRLVDHEGKPAANIPVVARNATQKWERSATTTADGRFEIIDIPTTMKFVLSVAAPADGGPSPALPIPTRYYPAATTEAAARLIALPATGTADNLDFALAAPLRVIESTGRIKSREHARRMSVTATVGTSTQTVQTDERGRFKVRHFPGTVTFEACLHRLMGPSTCKTVERKLEAPGKVDIAIQ